MLTAAHIIPRCNLHQLHEKHCVTRREAVSRAKWGAVNASPASSQLLNWFLSVTSERIMGSHTARPWKSETFNTTLGQNSKSAPKCHYPLSEEFGRHFRIKDDTHTATVQLAQKVLPALLWGAQLQLSSQPPLLLPGQHCCQGLGRAQELLHRLLCQGTAAPAFNIIMNDECGLSPPHEGNYTEM